jgi:hypothetical protein
MRPSPVFVSPALKAKPAGGQIDVMLLAGKEFVAHAPRLTSKQQGPGRPHPARSSCPARLPIEPPR